MFGTAEFYADGKYYDLCKKTFFSNGEVSPLCTRVVSKKLSKIHFV